MIRSQQANPEVRPLTPPQELRTAQTSERRLFWIGMAGVADPNSTETLDHSGREGPRARQPDGPDPRPPHGMRPATGASTRLNGSPRVVGVSLTDGSAREAKLLAPSISSVVAHDGVLFAAFSDATTTGVLRFDSRTRKSERIFDTARPHTLLALHAGPSGVWIATWTGLSPARMRADIVGFPLSTSSTDASRRVTRETGWAAGRWSPFTIHEDDLGNV